MNSHTYYSGAGKGLTRTFRIETMGYLLPNDDELVSSQNLNIRAKNMQEACAIATSVRDVRLNCLWTTTTATDLQDQNTQTWTSSPVKPKLSEASEQDNQAFSVVLMREAGTDPLTGQWTDLARSAYDSCTK